MARLSGKRRSYVHTLCDWPSGTRDRGWGYLHDQVWFPVAEDDQEQTSSEYEVFNYKYYKLYMNRRMLWLGPISFRVHTFYQGDDDAAVHDHPWWFVTIPLRSYTETYEVKIPDWKWYDWRRKMPGDHPTYWVRRTRLVRRWMPHFRRATHRHFVHEPRLPTTTMLMTGPKRRDWGFWPDGDRFVSHREWTDYNREEKEK